MIGETVTIEDGTLALTPDQMARMLGIEQAMLREELRAGRVFSVVERGEGEDAGRLRGRLRWRSLEVTLVVDAAGTVLEMHRSGDWRG